MDSHTVRKYVCIIILEWEYLQIIPRFIAIAAEFQDNYGPPRKFFYCIRTYADFITNYCNTSYYAVYIRQYIYVVLFTKNI